VFHHVLRLLYIFLMDKWTISLDVFVLTFTKITIVTCRKQNSSFLAMGILYYVPRFREMKKQHALLFEHAIQINFHFVFSLREVTNERIIGRNHANSIYLRMLIRRFCKQRRAFFSFPVFFSFKKLKVSSVAQAVNRK
jgi:hypothetical protein